MGFYSIKLVFSNFVWISERFLPLLGDSALAITFVVGVFE
jgi:hypothetical protein